MWRVQGFVGRVLSRFHGNAPLRLSQNHHVEDEVINTSTLLSTSRHSPDSSSQQGEDGEKRKWRRTSQFCYARLPRYTALDAVGWGAAAVLVVQICKRIHSQFSSGGEPGSGPGPVPGPGHLAMPATLHRCGYRVLLEILSRRDVLPRGRGAAGPWGVPGIQALDKNEGSSSDLDQHHAPADSTFSHQQGAGLSQEPPLPEEPPSFPKSSLPEHKPGDGSQQEQENDQDFLSAEERLEGAALHLRQVADSSIPVTLNIIGLESVESGDLATAFTCFLAAAHHGYSKAQFNTGVCYERGRGVGKDRDKALQFYGQAAAGGHSQAQYRCARLLLGRRGQQSTQDLQQSTQDLQQTLTQTQDLDTAVTLLEQASAAGLTQAQVFLGTVFSQEPLRDGRKSVHYLKMAAESGDKDALLFLGQCYESGFGVRQSLRTAVRFYQQAAQAGNSRAKSLLTPPGGLEEEAVLRSIHSSPCFPSDARLHRLLSDLVGHAPLAGDHAPRAGDAALPLAHSWSTGSIMAPPALSSLPLHLHPLPQPGAEGAPCRWTIGVG